MRLKPPDSNAHLTAGSRSAAQYALPEAMTGLLGEYRRVVQACMLQEPLGSIYWLKTYGLMNMFPAWRSPCGVSLAYRDHPDSGTGPGPQPDWVGAVAERPSAACYSMQGMHACLLAT